MPAMLEIALALARAGLPIFPVRITWNGAKWLKHPCIKWRNRASTNEAVITAWWQEFSDAVPGIELGQAGFVVIDCDRHGGPDGVAAFAELGPMPLHPVIRTAGDGEHHIFRGSIGNSRGALPAGIDVRGRGGWIVAPSAIRPDGARWSPMPGTPRLEEGPIPMLPESIAGLIGASLKGAGERGHQNLGAPAAPFNRSTQNPAIRSRSILQVVECARPGDHRNDKLHWAACRFGEMVAEGVVPEAIARQLLESAAWVCGHVAKHKLTQTRATIESGLRRGQGKRS